MLKLTDPDIYHEIWTFISKLVNTKLEEGYVNYEKTSISSEANKILETYFDRIDADLTNKN